MVDLDGTWSLPCGDAATHAWDFGDGSTSEGVHVSHTFMAGIHQVTLRVSNGSGASASVTRQVVVTPSVLPNLVLGLHLDGDVTDWSGKNNTVSVEQGTASYVDGRVGKALALDGTQQGSYVKVAHKPVLDDVAGLTLACWARRTRSDAAENLIYKHVTYRLALTATGALAGVTTGAGEGRATATTVPDTHWHHYAAAYDGTTLVLYVDGQEVAQSPLTGRVVRSPDREVCVGKNPWGASLAGDVDEVHVYDRALSAEEVRALYQGQ